MLRLLIGVSVIYLLYRLIRGSKGKGPRETPRPFNNGASGEDLVEDPLCHTYIPVSRAFRESIDGRILYFCSRSCLEQYKGKRRDAETQRRKEAGS